MGSVICTFKVFVSDMDNFDSVKKKLLELKPERLEEEALAFGLKAIKIVKFIPDAPGGMEELEDELNGIEGVSEVETVSISRGL